MYVFSPEFTFFLVQGELPSMKTFQNVLEIKLLDIPVSKQVSQSKSNGSNKEPWLKPTTVLCYRIILWSRLGDSFSYWNEICNWSYQLVVQMQGMMILSDKVCYEYRLQKRLWSLEGLLKNQFQGFCIWETDQEKVNEEWTTGELVRSRRQKIGYYIIFKGNFCKVQVCNVLKKQYGENAISSYVEIKARFESFWDVLENATSYIEDRKTAISSKETRG